MNTLGHCLVLWRLLWYLRSCKMVVVVVVAAVVVVVVVVTNFVVVDIVVTGTQKIVVVVVVGLYYCNMLTMLKLCTLVNLWSL